MPLQRAVVGVLGLDRDGQLGLVGDEPPDGLAQAGGVFDAYARSLLDGRRIEIACGKHRQVNIGKEEIRSFGIDREFEIQVVDLHVVQVGDLAQQAQPLPRAVALGIFGSGFGQVGAGDLLDAVNQPRRPADSFAKPRKAAGFPHVGNRTKPGFNIRVVRVAKPRQRLGRSPRHVQIGQDVEAIEQVSNDVPMRIRANRPALVLVAVSQRRRLNMGGQTGRCGSIFVLFHKRPIMQSSFLYAPEAKAARLAAALPSRSKNAFWFSSIYRLARAMASFSVIKPSSTSASRAAVSPRRAWAA